MTSAHALPCLEGLFEPARAERAMFAADGEQTFRHEAEGVQVVALGRLRMRDAALAERAARDGPAAALAQGWLRHGDALLEQVSGDYLIAIWQPAARRGVIAVDRFSTYALYWGEHGGRVAFATRPGRVCELLGTSAEIEPRAVHAYAYFHMIPAPLAVYRGVRRLDVGRALAIGGGRCDERTHWQPRFDEAAAFEFGRAREDFMAALRSGVRECIDGVEREHLGCFLSGGTDSSTISGLVTQAYGGPARTFSIGFDVSGYDERHYSRVAAKHFGTEHTEHVLGADEADRAIDVLAGAYEQPFGNSSAVPTYVCAKIARESGIRRMLGGDGGDELYGGNERYAMQWIFSLYDRVPGPLRSGLLEPLLFGPFKGTGFWPIRKARGYVEQARVRLPDRLGAKYNLLNRFGAARVLSEAVLGGEGGFDPVDLEREVWARCSARAQINRLLAYDFKFTLGDNDLPKVTRMCHAAGTQVAFPMLADAVTDHSLSLPPDQKLRRTKLRHFFRESLRGFLPDEIIDKPKHGFGMPFGDWLLAQPRLADRAQDALSGLARRGLVRPEFLDELHRAVRGGDAGYYGTMTWVLMMLELWLRNASEAAMTAPGAAPGAAPRGVPQPERGPA